MARRSPTLTETLRQAFRGDQQAVAILVRAWGPDLARVAGRCLTRQACSEVDPEDLVQEVFASFFSYPPEPLPSKPVGVRKWLRRAVHDRAVDANRHASRARRDMRRVQSLETLTAAEAQTLVSHEIGPAEAAAKADE